MSKIKTNRAMAKRLRIRQSGSFKRKKAFHSHILTKKSTKRCRNLRARGALDESNEVAARRQLPYASK